MPGFQAFRSNGARGRGADVLFTVGTERRGKDDPCHKRRYAAFAPTKIPLCRDFLLAVLGSNQ
jgi:hypothetical protein